MKLQCQRSSLSAAFQTVSAVVPTRTPKEILKNVKMRVEDGKAVLIATDQEVGIRCEVADITTDSSGEALLPTQRFGQILRELQDNTITLEVTEEALWIRGGRSEFRLSIEDPMEFPDVPTFDDKAYFVLTGKYLKQGIQRTIFAADVESTRYALGGVLLDLHADSVTLAATDSRRLAVMTTLCATHGDITDEAATPVIPSKGMQLIERSIHNDEQEVHIALHQNDVLIRSGETTIYARLVEGRFPKYQDVLPTSFTISIELVVGPLLSAVRQSIIVTNEESRGVDFQFADGNLTLSSVGAEVGSSKIELPVSYDGEPITVTFDPKFVAEFLKVLDPSSVITLNLVDHNSAAVFKADGQYTYVVMPLARD